MSKAGLVGTYDINHALLGLELSGQTCVRSTNLRSGVHIAPKHCHQEPRLLISRDTNTHTHTHSTFEPDYWEFHVYILAATAVMSERSGAEAQSPDEEAFTRGRPEGLLFVPLET